MKTRISLAINSAEEFLEKIAELKIKYDRYNVNDQCVSFVTDNGIWCEVFYKNNAGYQIILYHEHFPTQITNYNLAYLYILGVITYEYKQDIN